jgi:hypothetical protein
LKDREPFFEPGHILTIRYDGKLFTVVNEVSKESYKLMLNRFSLIVEFEPDAELYFGVSVFFGWSYILV